MATIIGTDGDDTLNGTSGADTNDGRQAFTFIGTGAFTGIAGQLRYEQLDGTTYVSGDTDGDGLADFLIQLDGTHNLVTSDFFL